MNIAVITYVDYAYLGENLYHALSRHTNHSVSYADNKCSRERYAKAVRNADVIIVAGDSMAKIGNGRFYLYYNRNRELFKSGSNHPVTKDAVLISMPCGTRYRRISTGYKATEVWPLSEYRKNFDIITPTQPDLNYPEINDGILQAAVDTDACAYSYKGIREDGAIAIGAYMGCSDTKNINKYLLPALDIIRDMGIKYDLTVYGVGNMVNHQTFINAMREYTIYYGQITPCGNYSVADLEAISTGVPTILGITDEAIMRAGHIKDYGAPFIKAHSVDDVALAIRNIAFGKKDIAAISREGRDYAVKWHSYKAVAQRAEEVIAEARERRRKRKNART